MTGFLSKDSASTSPRRGEGRTSSFGAWITLLGPALGGAAVLLAWYAGDTSSSMSEVARFLPVSDALGYHGCATSLAASGRLDASFGVDWCARRVLYTTMLASLLSTTGYSSQLALVLQGAIVGLAIAAFSLQVRFKVGTSGAIFTAALLSVFAWEFTVGLFMTEVAGFSLGLLGLTVLMSFSESRRISLLFAGAAIFSIALMARAGAMFVLPGLVAWTLLAFRNHSGRYRLKLFGASLAGVSIGPLLQIAVVFLLGADPSHTGGNFSSSLYGLSTGSRDWTEAYRTFESAFKVGERTAFPLVYAAALQNIVTSPVLFVGALFKAFRIYWLSLFSFGIIEYFNPLITGLAALGVLRCLLTIRSPWASLLLVLGATEALTSPLIIDSGGVRVFAATAPVRILFSALGLYLLVDRVRQAFRREAAPQQSATPGHMPAMFALTAGTVLTLMMIAPATPLAQLSRVEAAPPAGCPAGLSEVIARVDKETQMLVIADRATAVESLHPFRIGRQRLTNDSELENSWLGPYLLNQRLPLTVIRALDLSSAKVGSIKHLAFNGELSESNRLMSFCVDPVEYVDFGNVKHFLIKQVAHSQSP